MELHAIPENPLPSNAFVGAVVTPDGVSLRFARWKPTTRRTRGTVCLIQGRAEFIEKYFETVVNLRRRGFAVLAFDLRGQGGSDRMLPEQRKGHVDDFTDYVVDLEAVIEKVMLPSMPSPYFALAHSMGAGALLLALHHGETRFDRVALLAPLIGLTRRKQPWLAQTAATLLDFVALGTRYIPGGGATSMTTKPFPGNQVTSDPIRYARVEACVTAAPHLALGDPTIRWVFSMFQQFRRFADRDFGRRIATPSIMVLPGADPICSTAAAEALAARIRACQPIIIPGAKHELLMEKDVYRQQFFAAFDRFIPGESQESDLVSEAAHPDDHSEADETVASAGR